MMSGQKRCSHENKKKRRFREISPFFSTLKFFEILQMHFGVFEPVAGFEPTKAFLREEGGTRSVTEGVRATLKFD